MSVDKKNNLLNKGTGFLKGLADAASPYAKKALDAATEYTKETLIPGAKDAANKASDYAKNKAIPEAKKLANKTKETVTEKVVPKTQEIASSVTKGAVDLGNKAKDQVVGAIDANGDGKIDIEDVILIALRVPGVKVNRAEFLRRELAKNYKADVIEDAVNFNPSHAGISIDEINKIADQVIELERRNVSGISAALGTAGGLAMAASIPADIAQFYGFMLRAIQELMYLYGWPDIEVKEGENLKIDSETMNIIILCLGAMYGVNGASQAIKYLSNGLAKGVEKKLIATALTKGTVYPIVKSVARWFNVSMTKKMFASAVGKSIPVLGAVISGGITYASFKPCCDKLKASLQDTMLSNPNSKDDVDDKDIADIAKNNEEAIDAEIEELKQEAAEQIE